MQTALVVPPAPKVLAKDLPDWRQMVEFPLNTIGTFTDHSFELTINHRRILGIDSWLVNDPDGVRHILGPSSANYKKPVSLLRVFRPLAGAGLLLAEGSAWRAQRRVLAPVFTPANVGLLLPHFVEAAQAMVRNLDRASCVNLAEEFQKATLDAVLRALFSLPGGEERGALAAQVRGYLNGPGRPNILDGLARSETSFGFALSQRRRFEVAWNKSIDSLVRARRTESRGAGTMDLLDLLIAARDPEGKAGLSDAEIRDQSATMIAAGHETTARLLFWATYLLTLDEDEQARLRAEIVAFPFERLSSLDDLQNWPRLRQTLYEALRLYPPVPNMVREAIIDDTVLGRRIGVGAQVWISPWVIHRHRKFWDHPTAFMPDRFAEKASPWTGEAFFPFGAGPRICIGAAFALAEAQIMMAALLSRFKVSLEGQRPVIPVATTLLAPNHNPMFKIERA